MSRDDTLSLTCANPNHLTAKSIHPSIFYTRLICQSGRGGAGAYPSGHRARGGVHPGQVASPSQGHTETNETNNHACSHSLLRAILETPINLTCLFLDGGRKPEYPEREPTHTRGEHANFTQKGPSWVTAKYDTINLKMYRSDL